jgi:hypothetical protein
MASVAFVRFCSILCVALVMAGSLAHLFELPHKMALSGNEYLTVQQLYRGWALFGIPAVCGLALTAVLAMLVRGQRLPFRLTLMAEACIALSLGVFFLFTLPVNKKTVNWTVLPDQWESLRRVWEYSHVAGALLYSAAFVMLVLGLLAGRNAQFSDRFSRSLR